MAGSNGCRGEEKSAAAGSALELSVYFLGNTSYARAPSECDRLPLTIVAPCQSQTRLTYQFGNPTPLQLVQSSLTATLALLMLIPAAPSISISQSTFFHRLMSRFCADYGMPLAPSHRSSATSSTMPDHWRSLLGQRSSPQHDRSWIVRFWKLDRK